MINKLFIGDFIFLFLLAMAVTVLGVIGLVFGGEIDVVGIIVLAIVIVGFWGLLVGVIVKDYLARPDIVIKHYVTLNIYSNNVAKDKVGLSQDIRLAINTFLKYFDFNSDIQAALDNIFIEFRAKPISFWNKWVYKEPKAGLQKGKSIVVQYFPEIEKSAFIHALMHVVDEFVHHRYDPKHEVWEWWQHEGMINQAIVLVKVQKERKDIFRRYDIDA